MVDKVKNVIGYVVPLGSVVSNVLTVLEKVGMCFQDKAPTIYDLTDVFKQF